VLPSRHHADGPDLRHRLDDENAGHYRVVREVSLEERLVLGDVLQTDRPDAGLELLDPVHQQERIAVRYELADLGRSQRRLHTSVSATV
jgi:hypothetical protein